MAVSKSRRLRVIFFIPNLAGGGAERVLITLLKHLDRARFESHLVVSRLEGPHVDSVPADVHVTELASRNLWTVTPKLTNVIFTGRMTISSRSCANCASIRRT